MQNQAREMKNKAVTIAFSQTRASVPHKARELL